MTCTIDEGDSVATDAITATNTDVHDLDQINSNAVIEDYKKEIESLNRKHENEIAEKDAPLTDTINPLPTITDVPRLQLNRYSENTTSPVEPAHTYNEATTFNNNKRINLLNLKPLNNTSGISENNVKSNEVINNYLKATSQNDNYMQSTSKQNNLSKAAKPTKIGKKSKPTVQLPDKNKPKAKPGDKIDEFHIEKVESWMSIHEKRFSDNKCDAGDTSGAYNNDWRETPNSKTDDEGNFSFEDPIDDASNEESNYDEIVSVIKEIDEEKSKDLGKSEWEMKWKLLLNFLHYLEALEHTGTSSVSTLKLKTSARSTTPDKMA